MSERHFFISSVSFLILIVIHLSLVKFSKILQFSKIFLHLLKNAPEGNLKGHEA